jgi:hypothetical protein
MHKEDSFNVISSDLLYSVVLDFAALLLQLELFPEDELLHLARHCQRIFIHELHVFGYLVVGYLALAVVVNIFSSYAVRSHVFHLDDNSHFLPVLLIGNCNDLGIEQAAHLS